MDLHRLGVFEDCERLMEAVEGVVGACRGVEGGLRGSRYCACFLLSFFLF